MNWRDLHGGYPATAAWLTLVAILIGIVQVLQFFGLAG